MQNLEGKSNSYIELIYDLKSWAYMGKYYANKIRGAYYIHAYRNGLGIENQKRALIFLNMALVDWKTYASTATRNYNPQFLAKTRTVDWEALTVYVEKDIEIVKATVK